MVISLPLADLTCSALVVYYLQIGAAYNKDAYVQNELVLAALKTATDHLVQGNVVVTPHKCTDYNFHVRDITCSHVELFPFCDRSFAPLQAERFARRCTDPLTTTP